MVSVITFGTSVRRAFSYNENKLDSTFINLKGEKQLCASLLMAENYPLELSQLTRKQRVDMLIKTAARDPDCVKNTMHIFLSFAPGEQLEVEKLKAIAAEYMQGIGFGGQPYLVYQHHDNVNPHLHIVTVRVNPAGKSMNTYHIGKLKSEPIRVELEKKYGLVEAQKHRKALYELPPLKVLYGKTETKNSISHVLDQVLPFYNFCSLTELNAILKKHNVIAHQGKPGGRIERNGGLVYQTMDQGKPAGPPIKASLFYSQPTLTNLEMRFQHHQLCRDKNTTDYKSAVIKLKAKISLALRKNYPEGIAGLQKELLKSHIDMVIAQNRNGEDMGITFVDREKKLSIKGSDLGKTYSLLAIAGRLNQPLTPIELAPQANTAAENFSVHPHLVEFFRNLLSECLDMMMHPWACNEPTSDTASNLMQILLRVENTYQTLPLHLRKKKKKRKKKNTNR